MLFVKINKFCIKTVKLFKFLPKIYRKSIYMVNFVYKVKAVMEDPSLEC